MLKRSTTPFGSTLGRTTGWVHRAELQRNGVKMIKGVEYRKIDDAGVHIAVDGKESVIPADTVVLCAGQEPKRELQSNPSDRRREGSRRTGRQARHARRRGTRGEAVTRRVLFVLRGKLGDTVIAFATVRAFADAIPAMT